MINFTFSPKPSLKNVLKYVIILAIFFGLIYSTDRVLGLLGFEYDLTKRIAHPPNYQKIYKNIEFEYTFTTNSMGLRNEEIPLKKPKAEKRILLLGDSFVEGVGVENDQTVSKNIERLFPDSPGKTYRFINGGLGGTGPEQYFRLFYNVGLKYKLDGVLICIYANDVSNTREIMEKERLYTYRPVRRGMKRFLHTLLPRTYTLINHLYHFKAYKKQTQTTEFTDIIAARARHFGVADSVINRWKSQLPPKLVKAANQGRFSGFILSFGLLMPYYWSDAIDVDRDVARKKYDSMIYTLNTLIAEADKQKIETAIVYFPSRFQYDPSVHKPDYIWKKTGAKIRPQWLTEKTKIQSFLSKWAEETGKPYLDMTSYFRNKIDGGEKFTWEIDDHWNPLGYELAAVKLYEWMTKNRIYSFLPQPLASIQ